MSRSPSKSPIFLASLLLFGGCASQLTSVPKPEMTATGWSLEYVPRSEGKPVQWSCQIVVGTSAATQCANVAFYALSDAARSELETAFRNVDWSNQEASQADLKFTATNDTKISKSRGVMAAEIALEEVVNRRVGALMRDVRESRPLSQSGCECGDADYCRVNDCPSPPSCAGGASCPDVCAEPRAECMPKRPSHSACQRDDQCAGSCLGIVGQCE